MATEENTPTSVAAAVTVLPAFDKPAAGPRAPKLTLLRRRPELVPVEPPLDEDGAESEAVVHVPDSPAALVDLGAAELSVPVLLPPAMPLQSGAPAVELVQDSSETPAAEAPVADPAPGEPTVAELREALRLATERADAAEAANAVLRRKVAQLDDELAAFRPRAIVPFEDNTD
jgi:hypothetical protein